jgi:hypothetical protein
MVKRVGVGERKGTPWQSSGPFTRGRESPRATVLTVSFSLSSLPHIIKLL